jgi:hypothetical protein
MSSTPTPTQQRNSFSEGFASGLVLNGCWALQYDKVAIDLAVTGAFRVWSHVPAFPQVATDTRGLDGIHAMTRADRRKQTFAFYWDTSGPEVRIVSRDPEWADDQPDDVSYALQMVGDQVPLDAWRTLGSEFLSRYER